MTDKSFICALSDAIASNMYNSYVDNVDPHHRLKPAGVESTLRSLPRKAKDTLLHSALRAGFVRVTPRDSESIRRSMSEVFCRADSLAELYESLGDEESRSMLIAVLAFRILGSRKVKLPLNQPGYWAAARHVEQDLRLERGTFAVDILDGLLNLYDLSSEGFPLRVHAHHLNIRDTFILQQYRYSKGGASIEAKSGDVVIDGGGCWGDTALYFSHLVRPKGAVFCFEFVPDNLSILRANLDMNPNLKSRVSLVEKALWDQSEESLRYDYAGPGTSVVAAVQRGTCTAKTLSIDDLVARNGLDRVDFIKLDVEGAELRTLMGARHTLNRFRPMLAVALYHSLDDFVAIPAFLRDLDVAYEFYLDHFTIHQLETVLFARPRTR